MTPYLMMAAAMRYGRPERLWRFVRTDDGIDGPRILSSATLIPRPPSPFPV